LNSLIKIIYYFVNVIEFALYDGTKLTIGLISY